MFAALIAFTGALVYGSADFLGGLAARRLRSIVVTAVAAATGLLALLAALPLVGGAWLSTDVMWGLLSGMLGVVAIVLAAGIIQPVTGPLFGSHGLHPYATALTSLSLWVGLLALLARRRS